MIGGSANSWEEAVQSVVEEVGSESSGITRVYVENLSCRVDRGKVVEYRASIRLIIPAGE